MCALEFEGIRLSWWIQSSIYVAPNWIQTVTEATLLPDLKHFLFFLLCFVQIVKALEHLHRNLSVIHRGILKISQANAACNVLLLYCSSQFFPSFSSRCEAFQCSNQYSGPSENVRLWHQRPLGGLCGQNHGCWLQALHGGEWRLGGLELPIGVVCQHHWWTIDLLEMCKTKLNLCWRENKYFRRQIQRTFIYLVVASNCFSHLKNKISNFLLEKKKCLSSLNGSTRILTRKATVSNQTFGVWASLWWV